MSDAQDSTTHPILYGDPRPLTPARHGDRSLKRLTHFKFARQANSVPLNLNEVALASRHYPIVFTASEPASPAAVLGVRNGENLFVEAWGGWAEDHYVPAYVRRYPFIFIEEDSGARFTLAIDEASGFLIGGASRPLFTNGEPTEVTRGAFSFCSAFQTERAVTLEFARALAAHDLLVPNRADLSLVSGETLAFGGFRVVDEARLNALADDVFLDWRRRGWLAPIHAHLISMTNWARLADRADSRLRREGAAKPAGRKERGP
ncbi:MAG: SapC family protein [Alphaproteobacteria bacterium]